MFTMVNMAIIFPTNIKYILITLGDNVSIISIDESLTQRGRGGRGRGTMTGKNGYNIHYKYILIILGDNGFITSIDESLTQR